MLGLSGLNVLDRIWPRPGSFGQMGVSAVEDPLAPAAPMIEADDVTTDSTPLITVFLPKNNNNPNKNAAIGDQLRTRVNGVIAGVPLTLDAGHIAGDQLDLNLPELNSGVNSVYMELVRGELVSPRSNIEVITLMDVARSAMLYDTFQIPITGATSGMVDSAGKDFTGKLAVFLYIFNETAVGAESISVGDVSSDEPVYSAVIAFGGMGVQCFVLDVVVSDDLVIDFGANNVDICGVLVYKLSGVTSNNPYDTAQSLVDPNTNTLLVANEGDVVIAAGFSINSTAVVGVGLDAVDINFVSSPFHVWAGHANNQPAGNKAFGADYVTTPTTPVGMQLAWH
jgi:hypothetical protein